MQKAKFVKFVTVQDPNPGPDGSNLEPLDVELAIYKHENGGMFAIDASFVEQVSDNILDDDRAIIVDPFYEVLEVKGESMLLNLED